jgi:putative membrane protein insertion efficiency factor
MIKFFLKIIIKLYQYTISPIIGPRCRYLPSCSNYALEAIDKHGVTKGMFLSIKRISKCHPWGKSGHDPVPD